MMTAEEKALRKVQIGYAQLLKDDMSVEQKIEMLNTPYSQLPEELKPGMTKSPQMFNFVRMTHPNIGAQKETFAARLVRYRDRYHLTPERFCEVCNEFAQRYDLPATDGHRAQRTRITLRDLNNYENFNVCPKIDKMTVIVEAMGYSIDYFAGYGPKTRRRKGAA